MRINAGARDRDRDRENERSPPTHPPSRWANAGAACRRNWLSQRPHYGALRDINGTLLWQHQLTWPFAMYAYRDAPVRVLCRMHVCVRADARTLRYRYRGKKERGNASCRSRSSWIMQPYLYLVSDRDFWETVGRARVYVYTDAHATPRNRNPHTAPDSPIPPLFSTLSLSLSVSFLPRRVSATSWIGYPRRRSPRPQA